MGPRGTKMFPFADMRHCSEVLFSLSLRLMDRLIGSPRDGVDDVDHASGGALSGRLRRSLWDLTWF